MEKMSDKELVTYNHCAQCKHAEVCRHREDYLGYVSKITDLSNSLEGDKIAEGVVTVSVKCNHYEQLIPVPRSNFELR